MACGQLELHAGKSGNNKDVYENDEKTRTKEVILQISPLGTTVGFELQQKFDANKEFES